MVSLLLHLSSSYLPLCLSLSLLSHSLDCVHVDSGLPKGSSRSPLLLRFPVIPTPSPSFTQRQEDTLVWIGYDPVGVKSQGVWISVCAPIIETDLSQVLPKDTWVFLAPLRAPIPPASLEEYYDVMCYKFGHWVYRVWVCPVPMKLFIISLSL